MRNPSRAGARVPAPSASLAQERTIRALVALADDLTVERDESGLLASTLEHVVDALGLTGGATYVARRRARAPGGGRAQPGRGRSRGGSRARGALVVGGQPGRAMSPRRRVVRGGAARDPKPHPRGARAPRRPARRASPRRSSCSRRWASRLAPASTTFACTPSFARPRRGSSPRTASPPPSPRASTSRPCFPPLPARWPRSSPSSAWPAAS